MFSRLYTKKVYPKKQHYHHWWPQQTVTTTKKTDGQQCDGGVTAVTVNIRKLNNKYSVTVWFTLIEYSMQQ